MNKLLITGCGRSGTMFTSHVMRTAGFSCGHEQAAGPQSFNDNAFLENDIEVSWLIPRWLEEFKQAGYNGEIWHQVRHPQKVAASYRKLRVFENPNTAHYQCVVDILGDAFLQSPHKELDFVLAWSNIIEEYRTAYYKIENFSIDIVEAAGAMLGKEVIKTDGLASALKQIVNEGQGDPYKYDISGFHNMKGLMDFCKQYGYEVE